MPERDYIEYLSDIARMCVYFFTESGKVENFVVKLEYYFQGKWNELQRYDCEHGAVHKDILDSAGNKIRTVFYRLVDKNSGLDMAIEDFKVNFELYVWRYLNDDKEK